MTEQREQRGQGQAIDDGRDETEDEKADRKWNELLQELRVMQTGTQLIAGFLLTLPFQSGFPDLDTYQRRFYLVLVVTALVTTAFVLAPIAVHRRISGKKIKDRLVRLASTLTAAVLTGIGVLIVGIATFLFDVVVGRTESLAVGVPMLVLLLLLLVALPEGMLRRHTD
jgi:hypothetical protein